MATTTLALLLTYRRRGDEYGFGNGRKAGGHEKSSKMELVIQTWAGRTGPSLWCDQDYTAYDDQSSFWVSFWVSLRGALLIFFG
jgi:hypothetical protein